MPPLDGLGGGYPVADDDRSGEAEASATSGSTPSNSELNGCVEQWAPRTYLLIS